MRVQVIGMLVTSLMMIATDASAQDPYAALRRYQDSQNAIAQQQQTWAAEEQVKLQREQLEMQREQFNRQIQIQQQQLNLQRQQFEQQQKGQQRLYQPSPSPIANAERPRPSRTVSASATLLSESYSGDNKICRFTDGTKRVVPIGKDCWYE